LEETIQEIHKKMDESLKQMAIQTEEKLTGQKQALEDLEVGNSIVIPHLVQESSNYNSGHNRENHIFYVFDVSKCLSKKNYRSKMRRKWSI
jgi:hypothetical protein